MAISTAFCGGIGGLERSLWTLTEVLADTAIDIYANRRLSRGFAPRTTNARVLPPDGVGADQVDLYLYYATERPPYLGERLRPRRSAVVPCGNDVRDIEHLFDRVVCEAPDNQRYFDDPAKAFSLPPCVRPVDDGAAPGDGAGAPSTPYFLTVFNPYDLPRRCTDGVRQLKGQDLLLETADALAAPLVWCHSALSKDFPPPPAHPNIVHVDTPTQAQLRALYANALAYVCYSQEEGFGWAVADAMVQQRPIIARPVGVLGTLRDDERGHHAFASPDQLAAILRRTRFAPASYDLARFDCARFQQRVRALVDTAPPERPARA